VGKGRPVQIGEELKIVGVSKRGEKRLRLKKAWNQKGIKEKKRKSGGSALDEWGKQSSVFSKSSLSGRTLAT